MNLFVDAKEIRDEQEAKKQERLQTVKKHLQEMHMTVDKLNSDVREGYEAYKSGLSDRETYIQQKNVYDELLEKMEENIRKQAEAVNCIVNKYAGSPLS